MSSNSRYSVGSERLEENIEAVVVELTSEDLREMDSAASKITIQGARDPEEPGEKNRSLSVSWHARFIIMSTFYESGAHGFGVSSV